MHAPGRWKRTEGTLWRIVLDDAVISVPGRPEPFALSRGAALWALLDEPRTTDELLLALAGEAAAAAPAGGLVALLSELAESGAVAWLP